MASILLALGVNAWWDERVDQKRGAELLSSIRDDILSELLEVDEVIAVRQLLVQDARALLETMSGQANDGNFESEILKLGSIFILSEWQPMNASYDQALASGSFELVGDGRLRQLIARYDGTLEVAARWRDRIEMQYYEELEPFMVANVVYSELAAPDVRETLVVASQFATDFLPLMASKDLWNLLTLKLELEEIYLRRLQAVTTQGTTVLDFRG